MKNTTNMTSTLKNSVLWIDDYHPTSNKRQIKNYLKLLRLCADCGRKRDANGKKEK